MSQQGAEAHWTLNEEGAFEYRQNDTEEVLDVVPFEKARGLAAFFMWNLIESVGD